MKQKLIFLLILISLFSIICRNLNAQVFSGFDAFKKIFEYEGQRFLMDEIYQIKSTGFDRMKIDRTIVEEDEHEGFLFTLTSYSYNGQMGVVITSFNATNFQKTNFQFVNIHLSHGEFIDLYNEFISLGKVKCVKGEHILKRFNERLLLDANISEKGFVYYTLWVDNYSRHSFTPKKWETAFRRYKKFTKE